MVPDDAFADMIPWYANGTLSPAERTKVEAHLKSCATCTALLEDCRDFEGLGRASESELLEHVQAVHLDRYILDPASLPDVLSSWIRSHLGQCSLCRETAGLLASPPEAAGRAIPHREPGPATESQSLKGERRGPPYRRVWWSLTRTVLHPAAAGAYLIVLLFVSVALYRSANRTAPVPSVETHGPGTQGWEAGHVVDVHVLGAPLRGEAGSPGVRISDDARLVAFGIDLVLPPDLVEPASLRLEVRSETGPTLWSESVPAARARKSLGSTGLIQFLIPRSALAEGRYGVRVWREDRPGDPPLLETPFEIVPADR